MKQTSLRAIFRLTESLKKMRILRLNDQPASVGFIYRHIGETMNLFGQFFGVPTDVKNMTMGHRYRRALRRQSQQSVDRARVPNAKCSEASWKPVLKRIGPKRREVVSCSRAYPPTRFALVVEATKRGRCGT